MCHVLPQIITPAPISLKDDADSYTCTSIVIYAPQPLHSRHCRAFPGTRGPDVPPRVFPPHEERIETMAALVGQHLQREKARRNGLSPVKHCAAQAVSTLSGELHLAIVEEEARSLVRNLRRDLVAELDLHPPL